MDSKLDWFRLHGSSGIRALLTVDYVFMKRKDTLWHSHTDTFRSEMVHDHSRTPQRVRRSDIVDVALIKVEARQVYVEPVRPHECFEVLLLHKHLARPHIIQYAVLFKGCRGLMSSNKYAFPVKCVHANAYKSKSLSFENLCTRAIINVVLFQSGCSIRLRTFSIK